MSRSRLTPRWRTRATAAALVLPPLVYVVSLERIMTRLGRAARRGPDARVDDHSLAEWVDRVLHRLPPPWKHTCLKRALVLHYLVRRAGRDVELRIGVRRDDRNELAAHAWLVRDGAPYLEDAASAIDSYRVLASFPRAQPDRA